MAVTSLCHKLAKIIRSNYIAWFPWRLSWLGTIPSFAGKEMIFWSCPIVIIGTTLWGIYIQPILFLATAEWWAIESANNLIQSLWPSNQLIDMST